VHGSGELSHLGDALVSLGPGAGVSTFPEIMLKVSQEDVRRFGAHYLSGIARLAPQAGHVTNKMPSNFFFVGLIHMAFSNAPIIHLMRDPRDTCLSCFSKLFASGHYYSYDLAELGRYYRSYRAIMAHWKNTLPPERVLDVRYENLATNLEQEARRILAYCGLEWDARCLAFHETERAVRTASAAQVRRPINARAIGRARPYGPHLAALDEELGI
jgi:hypothetical protein